MAQEQQNGAAAGRRIVLTGGGTLGHVTPHLALLPHLLDAGYDVHYVGTAKGMEADKMQGIPGVTYHPVQGGKLRRYLSWQNLTDIFRVMWGAVQSTLLMGRLRPDVVFSKGGYVAVPVVVGAWLHRIPVVCHESDLTPGLANKLCKPFARRIATTFPECAVALGTKAEATGTPLRTALFQGDRQKGLSLMGFTGDRPIVLMMGGSTGAQSVNKVLREALPQLTRRYDVAHLCGRGNLEESLEGMAGYRQLPFLDEELPHALAAADLVLSRAGSNAICELAALHKPMLLVPYPKGASRGDQILNADNFARRGFCHVLLQENLTADALVQALHQLEADAPRLADAMAHSPIQNGTDRVLQLIEEVQK